MKSEKRPETLDDIELIPDAMAVTERAIKAAFRTGHVSKAEVKKTIAAKRKRPAAQSSSKKGSRN
jgi:hypothetical protein